MTRITKDFSGLMNDATLTAHTFLSKAIRAIDEDLGDGYAKEHPELIGAFMLTASIEDAATVIAKVLGEAIESVGSAIEERRSE